MFLLVRFVTFDRLYRYHGIRLIFVFSFRHGNHVETGRKRRRRSRCVFAIASFGRVFVGTFFFDGRNSIELFAFRRSRFSFWWAFAAVQRRRFVGEAIIVIHGYFKKAALPKNKIRSRRKNRNFLQLFLIKKIMNFESTLKMFEQPQTQKKTNERLLSRRLLSVF
jgi:hypothetical protein